MPFPELPNRVAEVRQRIDEAVRRGGHGNAVRIVAVTKTYGVDAVDAAWAAGIEDVGENRIQEALPKMDACAAPIRWHLIGHLQRNKARSAPRFHLFHALDSARLANTLDDHATRAGLRLPVLVQVNVPGEASKGGYPPSEIDAEAERLRGLRGLEVVGAMAMAPIDADEAALRRVFSSARGVRETLRGAGHPAVELSMGMSGDFEIAVEEGATFVRLGTLLFGERTT